MRHTDWVKRFVTSCFVGAVLTAGSFSRADEHTVSIAIDGRDELRISNGSMVVQHFSWSQPWDLTVDETSRPLSWNGGTSTAIAVPFSGDYWVKKTAGRDLGYAVQRSNGFALAASDNPNGADRYTFQLSTAPGANTTDWMHVFGAGAVPGRLNFAGTSGYAPRPAGEVTTFSLIVDGSDDLMFVDSSLVIRHQSWGAPGSLTINGVPQTLTFHGNLSEPIPLNLPDGLQFQQLGGRSALLPVQTPGGLLVGADDELVGADVYTWKITAETVTDTWRASDANSDGQVSIGDLGTLATHFGATSVKGRFEGDFNVDGKVSVGDLGLIATYFGKNSAPGALTFEQAIKEFPNLEAAIPEPTVGLALLALLPAMNRRRGR